MRYSNHDYVEMLKTLIGAVNYYAVLAQCSEEMDYIEDKDGYSCCFDTDCFLKVFMDEKGTFFMQLRLIGSDTIWTLMVGDSEFDVYKETGPVFAFADILDFIITFAELSIFMLENVDGNRIDLERFLAEIEDIEDL